MDYLKFEKEEVDKSNFTGMDFILFDKRVREAYKDPKKCRHGWYWVKKSNRIKKIISIYKSKTFGVNFSVAGYKDPRAAIKFYFIFFGVNILLPFCNSKYAYTPTPPYYGLTVHDGTLFINKGQGGDFIKGLKFGNEFITISIKKWKIIVNNITNKRFK